MIANENGPEKSYGLFALAIILILSGVVVNVLYFKDFSIRSISLLMVVVGAFLVRASNVRGLLGARLTNNQNLNPRVRKPPGPLAWALCVGSAVGVVISYHFMVEYLHAGGTVVWPVYAFAVCALIGTLSWSYVISKFF